ncbi:hypothetical protein D3C72_1429150 [compost metagenome]
MEVAAGPASSARSAHGLVRVLLGGHESSLRQVSPPGCRRAAPDLFRSVVVSPLGMGKARLGGFVGGVAVLRKNALNQETRKKRLHFGSLCEETRSRRRRRF